MRSLELCIMFVAGIQFFYISETDIAKTDSKLKKRFDTARQIKGTRRFHCFRPINSTTVDAFETSTSTSSQISETV